MTSPAGPNGGSGQTPPCGPGREHGLRRLRRLGCYPGAEFADRDALGLRVDTEGQWSRLLDAVRREQTAADRQQSVAGALQVGLTVVEGMLACSITEVSSSGAHTPAASNQLALQLDEAQYRAGSGPCVDAALQGHVQQVDVMSHDPRFAEFAQASVARGVHSSLSLPLKGAAWPAALNLYASHPGAFRSSHTHAVADLLARCTSALLQDHPHDVMQHMPPSSAHSQGELVRRAQQALAEVRGLTRYEAYTQLADWSHQQNRSIVAVAAELVNKTGQQHSEADGGQTDT